MKEIKAGELYGFGASDIGHPDEGERFLNRLIGLALLVFVFVVVLGIIVIAPGLLGNPIGSSLGYGGCPNCGDNWFWKSHGSIPTEPTRPLDVNNSEHIIYAEISYGIMICKECLANPAGLDEDRIKQDLLSFPDGGWTEEEAEDVRKAVIRYKKENLQNKGE